MAGWTVELLGGVAGSLTTLAFIPQVAKVWRTRRADDLSLPTFAAFTGGVALWLVYGVLVGAPAIIATNLVTFLLAGALVVMKVRFAAAGTRNTAPGAVDATDGSAKVRSLPPATGPGP